MVGDVTSVRHRPLAHPLCLPGTVRAGGPVDVVASGVPVALTAWSHSGSLATYETIPR
jgi:hypothetical protein